MLTVKKAALISILSVIACCASADEQVNGLNVTIMPSNFIGDDATNLNACLDSHESAKTVEELLNFTKDCTTSKTDRLAAQARLDASKQLQSIRSLKLSTNTTLQVYLELFYRDFGKLFREKNKLPSDFSKESDSDITFDVVDALMSSLINNLATNPHANVRKLFSEFGTDNPQIIALSIVQNALARPEDLGIPEAQIVRLHLH